ncbi:uncharacterized protein N7443_008444 [Penicillium atrosanguineum]|uniref:Rhodopsin domain-containing protein n=1 Tax=Penicillium atrosanguineum TaxID=1132637 RepID=A0A9W9PPV2_9EURO|nr:uncharacterized protein N7443_008444 [Penicillium atrosanguineum]KAJ5292491.1 hypothetical protein N7443_008444 [Penicillium atrosanguineum]KAJ5303486.1 hypothetical protein N7476_010285 [Penicillium atrosanguineum]
MLLNLHPHNVIAVGVILPTLASIAVGLRFYARHRIRVALREDDWTMLASILLVWGLGITNIAGAALGALGAHSKPAELDAPHDNTITRTRADIIVEEIVLGYSIVEKITFGVIKISVLMAYRRIFRGKIFNMASLGMIILCTLLALAFLITSAFQCHVRNWKISWSGYAISDVITDLILLFFPVPLVWKLQLTLSKKISVLLVFLLGSLSTAVGITRMVTILYFTYGTSDGYRDLLDTIATALIWSLVEASVAIIASCLPSIRPLIHRSSTSYHKSKPSGSSVQVSRPRASLLPAKPALVEFDDIDDRQHLASRLEEGKWSQQ